MAAKAAGAHIDDSGKEDIFEMQHHHLLRCLEKTTVCIVCTNLYTKIDAIYFIIRIENL